jgi:hypothetical protein
MDVFCVFFNACHVCDLCFGLTSRGLGKSAATSEDSRTDDSVKIGSELSPNTEAMENSKEIHQNHLNPQRKYPSYRILPFKAHTFVGISSIFASPATQLVKWKHCSAAWGTSHP